MSIQKSLSSKSISSLIGCGLVITSLVGFNSIAFAKDVQDTQNPETQSQQNAENPVLDSTQTNWVFCPLTRPCE